VYIFTAKVQRTQRFNYFSKKLSYGMNRVKIYEYDQFWKKHLQDTMIGYNLNAAISTIAQLRYKKGNATFFH